MCANAAKDRRAFAAHWFIYAINEPCAYCIKLVLQPTTELPITHTGQHSRPTQVQGIRVKFVYEGHRIKVKATGAKRSKIPIPAM